MSEEEFFISCEDRNYARDPRTNARFIEKPEHKHWHWEICDLCRGNGTYVNPNIDASGLTSEDFAEDPDFREDYFSGMYDVRCEQCRGRGSIPVVNEGCHEPNGNCNGE